MTAKLVLVRLAIAVSGGVLSSLAMPRENIWPLIFVSVAALVYSTKDLNIWSALIVGFGGGFAFYVTQIEWMSLYLGPVPLLALSFLEAVIFAIGLMVSAQVWQFLERRLNFKPAVKNLAVSAALATVFTAREWVAISMPYGGFPWSRLAQTQSDSPLADLVFFGGLGFLSWVVAFISVSLLLLVITGKFRIKNHSPNLAIAVSLVVISLIFTPAVTSENGSLKLAAVQGNANAGLFANPVRGSILQNHLDAAANLSTEDQLDLVVWPENASDLNPLSNSAARQRITDFVDKQVQTPLVFGTITARGENLYNSSLLWRPNLGPTDWYDKKRPVPFAEFVPDRDFWYSLAPDLVGLISRGYSFGERDGIFELTPGQQVGSLICFEIAIDEIGRSLVADGAQLILSQTNNADFGFSDETYQQFAFARLRAIETGRTIVNISTVGVSGIIDASGKVTQQLPAFEPGVMIAEVPLRESKTPAFFIAAPFDLANNLGALLLLGFSVFSKLRRRR